ncbi:MAG: pyruvate kinase [Spirochaetales bacterium]|nr:pyruvate kinase [Spirochaetales bacterium]
MNYTKIVATLGPSSEEYPVIKAILQAGCRVIRLNFSHGTHEEQQSRYEMARKAAAELGIEIAIFMDLQGPKIRLGALAEPSYTLDAGEELVLTTEACIGTRNRVSIDYPYLHEEIKVGNRVLINDGLVSLVVDRIEGTDIVCRMVEEGTILPRKGVNLPGVPLTRLSSFTEKDKADLVFGFKNKVDYVALSFVRSGEDVALLNKYMRETFGYSIPIISKIEKPEAVENIQRIIDESSAIMIARGDLGVEVPAEEVPLIQKSIIRMGIERNLPVITATQMLESMLHNPRPTRAETNDVANAVLDGTSAVMLSGETAAGEYPLQAVRTMANITSMIEQSDVFKREVMNQISGMDMLRKQTVTEAVGLATRDLALSVKASYIICFTHSGSTARLIAKFRPSVPIIAFSPNRPVVQYLCLSWGVNPIMIDELESVDDMLICAPEYLKKNGLVEVGDTVVITAGVPVGSSGKTNMIKVVEIE